MLKSDELKLTIKDKRVEVENFQREGKITEAKNAAAELTKLVDEYDVAIAMERSERDQMLKNSSPAHAPTNENSATLRNRAFNKLLLGRGRLTDEEKQAYFNVSGSPGQPGQIESIDEKGGYLVPEEHIAQIREYRKAYASLKSYCHVMTTTTTKGKYPTLGDEDGLLINFTEATDINKSDFSFGQVNYEIQDYGDIIPVSNQLIADANVNITDIIGQRLARMTVNTENALILSKLNTLTATTISNLNGLNRALIKDIDPAYWSNAKIYCNQDGFLWLSNLVDGQQRPLLQPDVTAPDVYRYKGKEIVVLPNSTMPNNTSGQTTTTPFFVGNLSDFLLFVERQGVEIAVSTEYLFAKYATALRCVVRFGATIDDGDAMKAYNVSIG